MRGLIYELSHGFTSFQSLARLSARSYTHCAASSTSNSSQRRLSDFLVANRNHRAALSESSLNSLLRLYSTAASKVATQDPNVILTTSTVSSEDDQSISSLSPPEVVARLDRYIIGQEDAKKAVAIAYRNRWRRKRIPESIRESVIPKNILMIGPTGCGKTEIARRLAKLADAPFIKVEATKFTEVGYHGGDVESIIKDLLENAVQLVKTRFRQQHEKEISKAVEDALLRSLQGAEDYLADSADSENSLESLRRRLRDGELEDWPVEVDPSLSTPPGKLQLDLTENVQPGVPILINLDKLLSSKRDPKVMKVGEARTLMLNAETQRLLPEEDAVKEAIRLVEEDGIVFIDEIDKIANSNGRRGRHGGDPSGEGVQRDLLPIIEGSVVNTKQGNVNTANVLFICSGAFHSAKPSDLMPELQGRLPIRVELRPLTQAEFLRVLTEPKYNLIRQQQVLLASEGVDLSFTPEALAEMSRFAEQLNKTTDNIGARRLHAVLERVVEEISFKAPELVAEAKASGQERCSITVDKPLVVERLQSTIKQQNYGKYVL